MRELAELLCPVRPIDDTAYALGQADGFQSQVVGGEALGRGDHPKPQFRRIPLQELRNLVELHLLAEARLRRAVTALGAAGRLVREDATSAKPIPRDVVGDR